MSTASGAALYVLLLGGKSDLPRGGRGYEENLVKLTRGIAASVKCTVFPARFPMHRRNARSRLSDDNSSAREYLYSPRPFFFSNNSRRRELSSVSNISSFTGRTAGIMRRDEKHRPARVHDGSCYAVIFIWGLMGTSLSARASRCDTDHTEGRCVRFA